MEVSRSDNIYIKIIHTNTVILKFSFGRSFCRYPGIYVQRSMFKDVNYTLFQYSMYLEANAYQKEFIQ